MRLDGGLPDWRSIRDKLLTSLAGLLMLLAYWAVGSLVTWWFD